MTDALIWDPNSMDPAHRVEELITPTMNAMGYDCVRVQIMGSDRVTVQIMAERTDETPMSVDDCAALSRELSPLLDVEDPVMGTYTLEVSSPGIDRPLVKRRDYERFAGFEARIETETLIGGRRKFTGTLLGADEDDQIHIRIDGTDVALPLAGIRKAKLLLTEALIEATQRRTM